ncbi:MAG: hypothetical protein R3E09_16105 [Novosphingobium sp.]
MRIDAETDRSMIATLHRPLARRPWLQLISAVLELAGGKAELLRHSEKPWASVTFSGTRHTLALAFNGQDAIAAGEDFIAALPEHEFTISRQLVADAAVTAVEHETTPTPRMVVEAEILLLEDA